MDNNPYAARLPPPSLVTVENGFTFQNDMDDSDLSSLNTTPRKNDQRKTPLRTTSVDEADLGLQRSRANRLYKRNSDESKPRPWSREQEKAMKDPPLQVVQVTAGGDRTAAHLRDRPDPRATNDQENAVTASRGRSRDEKLRDRKEKYRRMASPSSRRIRPTGGVLNSWKKKADERKEAAANQRVKPWYVPEMQDGPEDEQDELAQGKNEQDQNADEDDDDDISPIRAKKHTFEEDEEENIGEEEIVKTMPEETVKTELEEPVKTEPKETLPKVDTSPPEQSTASDEIRKSRSIVTMKHKYETERSLSPKVDMYGCPIFRVDSDGSGDDLTETKAKLDKWDSEMEDHKEVTDSIKVMLSTASFFSKSAAQTLSDAHNEGVKLLGHAAQGVEELVLGPVKEIDESVVKSDSEYLGSSKEKDKVKDLVLGPVKEIDESAVKSDSGDSVRTEETSEAPPPPKRAPPRRGRSPTAVDESTNASAFVDDDSAVDSSFVLDDKSDVDVHYVLDDLASFEQKKRSPENTKNKKAVEETNLKAVDQSYDSELFVEDEKVAPEVMVDNDKLENDNKGEVIEREAVEDSEVVEAPKIAESLVTPIGASDSREADATDSAPTDETPKSDEKATTSIAHDVEHKNLTDSSMSSENLIPSAAAIASAVGAAGLTADFTIPKNRGSECTLPIIVSNRPVETELEFPPTEDDAIDKIDFDNVSIHSNCTPVQGNLNDAREEPKDCPTKEESKAKEAASPTAKTTEASEEPSPPEAAPTPTSNSSSKKKATNNSKEFSKVSTGKNISNDSKVAATSKPAMVKTLDDNNGIAKGDIVLSLLNANLSEANRAPKGADQVRDAILRMRDMRKRQEKVESPKYEPEELGAPEIESHAKRSALPVDVDDMRVVGAFEHVKTLEEDAIEHLKVSSFDRCHRICAFRLMHKSHVVTNSSTTRSKHRSNSMKKLSPFTQKHSRTQ